MVSVYVDEHDAANKVCPAEHLFRVSEDTQLAGVVWCASDYICRPTFTSRQMSLVSTCFFFQGLLQGCSCALQVTPLDNLKTQVIVPNLDCAQNPRQIEWRIFFLFFGSWIHWIFAEDREDPKEKVLGTIFQSMRRPTERKRYYILYAFECARTQTRT